MTHPVLTVTTTAQSGELLLPCGITTPHLNVADLTVEGAEVRAVVEAATGQAALLARATADRIVARWSFVEGTGYPAGLFTPHDSRFTRSADALVAEATAWQGRSIAEIAAHVAELFTYGHPEDRFYDDSDTVPQLCGMTEGSCVDINLYFIAFLRAAGHRAGYITGGFFPAEKGGRANDMHCWVVTDGPDGVQEWDIAHHLKLGTRDIRPALDPKPGRRVPLAWAMGLTFPAAGLSDIKLMGEPMWVDQGRLIEAENVIELTPWT